MRPEKQLLLDEIREKIDHSMAFVLTRYQNLNSNKASDFRVKVLQAGGSFEVVRKRMLIKAAEAAGISLDWDALQGHIGVVFADKDPIQLTKMLYQFSQENEEVFEVLGGRFENRLCSATDVEQISKLPGRDEMRAQFIGLLVAPLSETLSVIDSLLTSVVYCLENKSQTNH